MADNYWEPGNLIAPIDPESGIVGRTFTGLGLSIHHVDAHPDTGRLLPGLDHNTAVIETGSVWEVVGPFLREWAASAE